MTTKKKSKTNDLVPNKFDKLEGIENQIGYLREELRKLHSRMDEKFAELAEEVIVGTGPNDTIESRCKGWLRMMGRMADNGLQAAIYGLKEAARSCGLSKKVVTETCKWTHVAEMIVKANWSKSDEEYQEEDISDDSAEPEHFKYCWIISSNGQSEEEESCYYGVIQRNGPPSIHMWGNNLKNVRWFADKREAEKLCKDHNFCKSQPHEIANVIKAKLYTERDPIEIEVI